MVSQYVKRFYDEESWKVDHDNAMLCYNIEAAIAVGLQILRTIDRASEADRLTVSSAFEQALAYQWWLNQSRKVVEAIEELRRLDYRVDGAEQFMRRFNDLCVVENRMRDAIESLRELKEGKGIRLHPDDLLCPKSDKGPGQA
jgi:hypothetical protein